MGMGMGAAAPGLSRCRAGESREKAGRAAPSSACAPREGNPAGGGGGSAGVCSPARPPGVLPSQAALSSPATTARAGPGSGGCSGSRCHGSPLGNVLQQEQELFFFPPLH